MGQIELLGITGPRSEMPSRFSLCPKSQLDNLEEKADLRNPSETYNYLTNALSVINLPNQKAKGEQLLKKQGLRPEMVQLLHLHPHCI